MTNPNKANADTSFEIGYNDAKSDFNTKRGCDGEAHARERGDSVYYAFYMGGYGVAVKEIFA